VKEARRFWDQLVAAYVSESTGSVGEALAASLSVVAGPEQFADVVSLLRDRSLGETASF